MYYVVEAKCGHVGRNNYIKIDFPVIASSKKEAASIVRYIPRVKHDKKDAIISVTEIGEQEYKRISLINSEDPYLRCSNIQEQRLIKDLDKRIVYSYDWEDKEIITVKYDNKKVRNVKKYNKYNIFIKDEYEYVY